MNIDYREGAVVLINKPLRWTSFDVVNKVRYALSKTYGQKKFKVGHAGTLDPLATGLLILCTGRFTKKLSEFQGLDKTYTGTIQLGATTASFDLETEVDNTFPTDHLTETQIREATKGLTGQLSQLPPQYSAKKVDGTTAYVAARKGEKLDLKPNPVFVNEFDLTRIALPEVDFHISCSKGTYIRSLARDLGESLQNGGHLTALCRTRIGNYQLEDATTIEQFIENVKVNAIT